MILSCRVLLYIRSHAHQHLQFIRRQIKTFSSEKSALGGEEIVVRGWRMCRVGVCSLFAGREKGAEEHQPGAHSRMEMSEHKLYRNLCFAQNSEPSSAKSVFRIYFVNYPTRMCVCRGNTLKFTFPNLCFSWIKNSGAQKTCVLLLNATYSWISAAYLLLFPAWGLPEGFRTPWKRAHLRPRQLQGIVRSGDEPAEWWWDTC